MKRQGYGDHNTYTIRDIAMDDTKIIKTAKTFDVPWMESS
jgi:hypothetical protein